MNQKPSRKLLWSAWVSALIFPFGAFAPALSAQTAEGFSHPASPFVGESACSTSGCHGGAGEKHDQCIRWTKLDAHTKTFATLTLARSFLIAKNLNINDPTQSERCTVCHEPYQTIALDDPAKNQALDPKAGVSCESCHGPAEKWLLGHTRTDWTHQDRVHAGMRDLDSMYTRANSCVACHQNVDSDLLKAGHPELIFELDGQSVTEPKHWKEKEGWSGPKTWLVGQAVALREMSWQLGRENSPAPDAPDRVSGLLWVMSVAAKSNDALPASTLSGEVSAANAADAEKWGDELAHKASDNAWSADDTRKCLNALAGTAGDFRQSSPNKAVQARRAERLVMGLDRLTDGLDDKAVSKHLDHSLNQLFRDVQSLPAFDSEKFASHLEEFQKALGESSQQAAR
jgi:hypothetical protein